MRRALLFCSLILGGCTAQIGPYVRDIQLDSHGRVLQFERCTTELTSWANRVSIENEAVCERIKLRNPPQDTPEAPR